MNPWMSTSELILSLSSHLNLKEDETRQVIYIWVSLNISSQAGVDWFADWSEYIVIQQKPV